MPTLKDCLMVGGALGKTFLDGKRIYKVMGLEPDLDTQGNPTYLKVLVLSYDGGEHWRSPPEESSYGLATRLDDLLEERA